MKVLIILPVVMLLGIGCATIIHGRSQDLTFASEPSGATIKIDGALKGVTPTSITLRRNKHYIVSFEKDGYEPEEQTIKSQLSPWLFGNILIGGIIGIVIDLAAGGAWTLSEDQVKVGLRPIGGHELQQGMESDAPQ